jgi:hypothetical protein
MIFHPQNSKTKRALTFEMMNTESTIDLDQDPVGPDPLQADDWRRNSKLPSERLDAPPMPDGRPLPCFFGRRFLTARELGAESHDAAPANCRGAISAAA